MDRSAEEHFQETFSLAPTAIGKAPGRVNLIGEHTDYNGGMVLPMALARSVRIAIGAGSGNDDQVCSPKYKGISRRRIGVAKSGDWSDYAFGALAKARELGLLDGPINLAISSTLPAGAGVSSSAALVTAVLRAACNMAGSDMSPLVLAHAARAVENDYIGVPCGIMDQMAVGLAAPDEALAIDTSTTEYERIGIPESFAFVTLHTGIHRKLSDGRYKQRFEECEAANSALGVEHLCLVDDEMTQHVNKLPPPLRARAQHVISEHHRTCRAREALKSGDTKMFGELMTKSHASYASDFEASTPEIDAIVNTAHALGAIGARLTGGGFGGCIVALVNRQDAAQWGEAMTRRFAGAWLV